MLHPDDNQSQQDTSDTTRAKDDLVEQALFVLTPFFLDGVRGDHARARRAAVELLKAYPINSMLELQLATEFIAFSQSAMEDLRLAKADPDMPESERCKLRAGAVALNRAGHRTLRILEKVFQARDRTTTGQAEPAPKPPPNLSPEQLAMLQAMRERVAQARAQMAAGPGASPGAMKRDQRRAAGHEASRATG
ncbi:MAG: hypothetical protein ACJ8AI_26680 [Rhodopila sp.]